VTENTIQFIDSSYNELFRIPDGGSIKITYPPEDGRGTVTRKCEYLDETHFKIDGNGYNDVLHICQFAERMEALGAKYEPEVQLNVIDILSGSADEAAMFYRNSNPGKLPVGHMRGDFGREGDRFYHSWTDHDAGRNTPEFKSEFQSVVSALRREVLKDYKSTVAYCYSHPEAKIPGAEYLYGFKLETEKRRYFVRCTTLRDDYFYVFVYDNATPEHSLETERSDGYTSVLKTIEDAKTAPKPPRKAKASRKHKNTDNIEH
jgi:hypothetical protein